jgi:hypothetical protein
MELRQRHPRRQGDLGEASAIQALTELGADLSVPLFHSPDYDLVAEMAGRLLRVQVKTSTCASGKGFRVQVSTSGGTGAGRGWSSGSARSAATYCSCSWPTDGAG